MEGQDGSSRRMCGAAAAYYLAVESHPEYRQGHREVEIATAQLMAEGPEALIPDEPITIPLVVHVVYHDDSENISDEQVESQITVLNQDFAATNPNAANVPDVWAGFVADTNIRFALAQEDPEGNSTSGITSTQTDRTEFGIDDSVKSADTSGVDRGTRTGSRTSGYATWPAGCSATPSFPVGHPSSTAWSSSTRPSAPRARRPPRSTEGRRAPMSWDTT